MSENITTINQAVTDSNNKLLNNAIDNLFRYSNWLYLTAKEHLTPTRLFLYLLTLGATIAVSALSYAGAVAIGLGFWSGVAMFALTFVVCIQTHLEMIEGALRKLKSLFNKNKPVTSVINSIIFLMSILAAISFSFSTLNAAIGLFSFNTSLLISGISSLAFFFISYEMFQKGINYIFAYNSKFQEFKNNLEKKHWLIRYSTIAACLFVFALSIHSVITTAPTWWVETQLGAIIITSLRTSRIITIITSPFAILSNSLYLAINSKEAILKLSDFKAPPSLSQSSFWQNIKNNPGLKYNPAYLLNTIIINSTGYVIYAFHSLSHAFASGSRTWDALNSNTILDSLADSNFTSIAHNHSHEPFDFIIMVAKVAVSLPLQALSIPTNIFITKLTSPNQSILDCIKKSFTESFDFVLEYIKSKKQPHSHCHGHSHAHENLAPKESPADVYTSGPKKCCVNLYKTRTSRDTSDLGVENNYGLVTSLRPS